MGRLVVAFSMAVLALRPSQAVAQVEVGLSVGAFWPLGGGWTPVLGSARPAERRQIAAHMVSARLAYWSGARLGVEATVGFTPSQVAVSDVGRIRDIQARVVLSSVRALARLASVSDGKPGSGIVRWDFNAGIGAAVMARRGSAWANVSGTTHPAALTCFEARTAFSRSVTIRVGVEDLVSWATFDRGLQSETRSRVQHDVVFTLGGQIPLGRRGPR